MIYKTGALVAFNTDVPFGFLLCNGALVSRTDYSELFSVIGTRYGAGDGINTFKLPSLDNIMLRQVSDKHAVGDFLNNCIKKHSHNVTLLEGGEHDTHMIYNVGTGWWEAGSWGGEIIMGERESINPYTLHQVSKEGSLHSHGIELDDYKGSFENYPDHYRCLWGIKC